jgi:hypothetical protein
VGFAFLGPETLKIFSALKYFRTHTGHFHPGLRAHAAPRASEKLQPEAPRELKAEIY